MVGKHQDFDPATQSARMRYNAEHSEPYEFLWDHKARAARYQLRGQDGMTGMTVYPLRAARAYIRAGNWTVLAVL